MACDDSATSAGATFLFDLDGTPPFTDLGDLIDVALSGITTESKEKTVLASAAQFKEYCPGFSDGGEVTFTVLAKKAKVAALNALRRVTFYGRLQWGLQEGESTPSYWEYLCFITNQGETHPAGGDKVTVAVTCKITGEPVFHEAT
jgi:hypothetical protein